MSIIYQNGKFINTIQNKLRQLENKINNGSSGSGTSITLVEHGTLDTNTTISPNALHKWDEVTELTLTLGAETPGIVNEYLIQFTSGSTPTVLTLPEDIKWSSKLEIQANKIYQISIVNNLATYAEFNASNIPIILNITEQDIQMQGETIMIINPDIINQLQTLCSWIVANEHTGEDIDNKIVEMAGSLPSTNTIPGVTYDDGLLIINFPPEAGLPNLVYGFGIRMHTLDPSMPASMCFLIPNDFMNNPISAGLDLSTGDLMLMIGG